MRRSRFSFALVLGIVGLTSGCSYNKLQTLDEQVKAAQGQITVQLQRRADLIPNLVETVKGYAKQEDTIFISLANARAAQLSGSIKSGDMKAMGDAATALQQPLGRLLAIAEAYPQLKSNENFKALQDQLEGTENRIGVARTDYNKSVETFNSTIRKFPTNLTAKMFGLGKPKEYFQLTSPGAAEVPKVKFGG